VKLNRDRIEWWLGLLTINVYWPDILLRKRQFHAIFKTQIIYRHRADWAWDRSFVLQILGFGVGFAWNHCDNPNYIFKSDSESKQ